MPRLYVGTNPYTGRKRYTMYPARRPDKVAFVRGYRKGRKGTAKSYNIYKSLSSKQAVEHQFVRSFENIWGVNYGTSVANGVNFRTWQFSLSQLPDIDDFSTLYDYMKVDRVILYLKCPWSMAPIADKSGSQHELVGLPVLHYVIDKDDDITPSSIDTLYQYPNHKCLTFKSDIKIKAKPLPKSILAESDAATVTSRLATDFTNKSYLDAANLGILHFFAKGALDCRRISTAVGPVNFADITEVYEVHFRCRGVR